MSFVLLLELNGVDMFLNATVSGYTSSYRGKTESYSQITFNTKFCSCEANDPIVIDIVRNLTREIMYKKFPHEYTKIKEINIETKELGDITLYNRNQELQTDINIGYCKTCWDRQNWD